METGPVLVPNTMVFPIIAGVYIYGASAMGENLGPAMQSEGEEASEDMEDDEGSTSTIEGVMEDIMESALQRDMERVGEEIAEEMEEEDNSIEPHPPFVGGDARLVWDTETGRGICWQVDVQTEEDGPMMSMF